MRREATSLLNPLSDRMLPGPVALQYKAWFVCLAPGELRHNRPTTTDGVSIACQTCALRNKGFETI